MEHNFTREFSQGNLHSRTGSAIDNTLIRLLQPTPKALKSESNREFEFETAISIGQFSTSPRSHRRLWFRLAK